MSEIKKHDYVIYVINIDENSVYIGSTKNLTNRIRQHRYACFNKNSDEYNKPLYKYIREHNIQLDDDMFSVISDYNNFSVVEATEIEEKHRKIAIRAGLIVLNSKRANATKEELKERYKKYNTSIKGREYRKKWEKTNQKRIDRAISFFCECGGKCDKKHKSTHERTDKHRLFFGLEVLRFICVCGSIVHPDDKKHFKSKKHLENLEKKL